MKYCSNCANTVELRDIEGDHLPRFVCDSCNMVHYQNPRLIVGALCYYGDRVLLCRRNIEPRKGYWNVPGGFMENGETVPEGAVREAREEAGVNIEVERIHTVFSIPRINQVHVHVLARMLDEHWELTPESSEIRFFYRHEIPWDEIAFESSKFILNSYFESLDTGTTKLYVGEYVGLTH